MQVEHKVLLVVQDKTFLTTGSKDNLGYIPLVIYTEDKKEEVLMIIKA